MKILISIVSDQTFPIILIIREVEYILSDDSWYKLKRNLRKKNYDEEVTFPKTRKLMTGGIPLGFVKLSLK